jgi:TonB family protein
VTKLFRVLVLALAINLVALAQDPAATALPTLTHFVAPAYPHLAKVQRILGKTIARLLVSPEGTVQDATVISGHALFKDYVLKALKEWRFAPSDRGSSLDVTFIFEFGDCDTTEKSPTDETDVSADLPTVLRIKTGLQCILGSVDEGR